MEIKDLENNVISVIEPIVAEEGCDLVDVEWTMDGGLRVLRVYIEAQSENGTNLDDCTRVSAAIEDIIEVEELVPGKYSLEVSSPGINRPLRTKEHFESVKNQTIKVTTLEKINGRGKFKGTLQNINDDEVTILIDNDEYLVPFQKMKRAQLITDEFGK